MPTRFARQDYFPPGWQEVTAQFLSLFHRYGYIYKPLTGGSWYSADERWKLADSEILKAIACVHPKFYVGCRAGRSTRFAVLDIDAGSQYHNQRSLEKLLQLLSEAGLRRSSLYRSSYGGGWHLYLFFDEPLNSADLRKQLFKLLALNDFEIGKGQLEIFPHPGSGDSLGLGLRLPLQPGFAWLDKHTLEVEYERHELNATKALELFVDALDSDANSYDDFRKLKQYVQELETRRAQAQVLARCDTGGNVIPLRAGLARNGEFSDFVTAVFGHLPPGIIVDNWYKGRLYHLNGLTGPSQRAQAIECLGHYFFYGDPSRALPALGYGYEQERQWAITEFLNARNNGQSEDINRGRKDALEQVERAANWQPAQRKNIEAVKYTPQQPIAWIRENANRKRDARSRIASALGDLKELRRSFTTVELQQAAGCSRETLYKHADIWRQDYEHLAEGFFAFCTDEYNDVEGAGCSETEPLPEHQSNFAPPGLLACRRVAYEISMRAQRDRNRARKAVVDLHEGAETRWRASVRAVIPDDASTVSVESARSLLLVMTGYLAVAPNLECQAWIEAYIERLRSVLAHSTGNSVLRRIE